jgi:predicted AAA+ superfamily ATPase
MVSKDTLRDIIEDQNNRLPQPALITREVQLPSETNRVIIVTGVRRCGKSILLRTSFFENGLYVNFEDPRLVSFEVHDFPKLEEIQLEQNKEVLLLDELQWVTGWEIFARAVHEKGKPLYITGSNASMLSRELGTRLTGRYKQIELYPFSFREFLDFIITTPGESSFEEYLNTGGFPEYLQHHDDDYLRTLLRDILTRDVAVRRNITNESQLVRLGVFLSSNIGKDLSYNRIAQLLEIKSVRTLIDYCDYLEESYLFDLVPLYSTSIRKQIANPKKIYCIDTALAAANSLSFSQDLGRKLENIVFLHLRRSFSAIHYFKTKNSECDFLVKWKEEVVAAIQVCWEINQDNKRREVAGVRDAMTETGTKKACIITFRQEDIMDGIAIVPAWKWLLQTAANWVGTS